jgi:hypothetical protein
MISAQTLSRLSRYTFPDHAGCHFTDVLKWLICPLDPGIERALLFKNQVHG